MAADGNGTPEVHAAAVLHATALHSGEKTRTGLGLSAGEARPILGNRERYRERSTLRGGGIMSDFGVEDSIDTIGPDGAFEDVGEDAEPYDEDDLEAWDEDTEAFDSEHQDG